MLVSEPSDFTSLKSRAYARLLSALGPSVRSIRAFSTKNGRTLPTHGEGSTRKSGGDFRHAPGVVPNTNVTAPLRPSFARAASIAAAAFPPTLIPPSFARPGGIFASDVSYWAWRTGSWEGTRSATTRKAAVAAAASCEYLGFAVRVSR